MSGVVEKPPAQNHTCCVHGNDGLQCLGGRADRKRTDELLGGSHTLKWCQEAELLTLEAVKVNMGRKMMESLASGILVQTLARMAMMAPD